MEYVVILICIYMQWQRVLRYNYAYDIIFKIKQITYSPRVSNPTPPPPPTKWKITGAHLRTGIVCSEILYVASL
jgi:hypothetical protein